VSLVDTMEEDEKSVQELMSICNFPVPRSPSHIRIASWNVLAPAYATSPAFPDTRLSLLRWSRRAPQIKSVLGKLEADIVCLQEADVLRPPAELGLLPEVYTCVSLKRPEDSRHDGCLIAWRTDRFSLWRPKLITFDDHLPDTEDEEDNEEVSRFRTGHCAVVTELRVRSSEKAEERESLPGLIVVCTHLAWGDDKEDVRLWQLSKILDVLKDVDRPVILCGDLNSTPDSRVRELLASVFDSAYEGLEELSVTTANANSYEGEGFAKTIDYVWLSKSGLQLQHPLQLPQKEELRALLKGNDSEPIPTLLSAGTWPSDHLPVGAEINL